MGNCCITGATIDDVEPQTRREDEEQPLLLENVDDE